MKKIKTGSIIQGKVTGLETYGIFVNIDDQYNGLIHISEIDNGFIKDINDYVNIGDTIYVNIIGIDKANNHLNLSIKNINYNPENENKLPETIKGFLPLYEKLPEWTEEALRKIKNK